MEIKLTATNVDSIFSICSVELYTINNENVSENYKMVEGLKQDYVFDSTKIEEHSSTIDSLTSQLAGSGSASLLALDKDKDGTKWGQPEDVEKLVALGVANGNFLYANSKDLWHLNPDGVPIILRLEKEKAAKTL